MDLSFENTETAEGEDTGNYDGMQSKLASESVVSRATRKSAKKRKSPVSNKVPVKQEKKVISFDHSCFSCSKEHKGRQIPQLMRGFKMACLQYKPSSIVFESKTFNRIQLIEAQGHLLYLALEQMQHLDFDLIERRILAAAAESGLDRGTRTSVSVTHELKNEPSKPSFD